MDVHGSLLDAVGATPLLRLGRVAAQHGHRAVVVVPNSTPAPSPTCGRRPTTAASSTGSNGSPTASPSTSRGGSRGRRGGSAGTAVAAALRVASGQGPVGDVAAHVDGPPAVGAGENAAAAHARVPDGPVLVQFDGRAVALEHDPARSG